MTILLYFLLLILGLVMISFGANYLTSGSVTIAQRLGVSQLIIGLTIVGFGTSAPELVVSITSALADKPDIAIANVVGSNIANILLILGVSAIIYPLRTTLDAMQRDIPIAILVTMICLVLANDQLMTGGVTGDIIDRGDGIVLLCLMFFYLYLTFLSVRGDTASDPQSLQRKASESSESIVPDPVMNKLSTATLLLSIAKVIGGLALLVVGGKLFVDNASGIARSWGVSEAIIGLTIVAIGTSLPELATSVVAAIKHQPDLAIGNVVGSNIFNIIFILGTSATITPLVPSGLQFVDYIMMLVAVFLLFVFSNVLGRAMISRKEGIVLLVIYLAYMVYLVVEALSAGA